MLLREVEGSRRQRKTTVENILRALDWNVVDDSLDMRKQQCRRDLGVGWSSIDFDESKPLSNEFFLALKSGNSVDIKNYTYRGDNEGLVWVTNDYGIDCHVFELSLKNAQREFLHRVSGAHDGPRDEPSPEEWRQIEQQDRGRGGTQTRVNTTLTRDQWITEVAKIWAANHGDAEPNKNLREYASAMAETYYDDPDDRYSPDDAVDEELSCS